MARKLKVFCTPIGFHDAYVAAASQKEALVAWGSDANLFTRGMASIVTDPALTKEPLAKPGQVVKRVRGTIEQHLAALPQSPQTHSTRPAAKLSARDEKAKPARPRPSRAKLDSAEQALEKANEKYDKAAEAIREREDAIRRERNDLSERRYAEIKTLEHRLDDVRAAYNRAMDDWRA